ncbi:MAG: methyltransferase domain-containing protein [Acidimicrobiia bacterium]|nr:methyltransferase domain-containing protein [Acidimicrobiia bacterium]
MWGEYALRANERGWEIARELAVLLTRGMPTLSGRRTLDVGSGVGGTVIGCGTFGAEAIGIEPDAERRVLAKANAADHELSVRFVAADLLDPTLLGRIGEFDAVTAIKVVEHVDDAEAGVQALASLTAEGGVVLTDIPNGRSVGAVRADGHYLLPGLTLIEDRALAARYHQLSGAPGVYDVTDHHGIDTYVAWFERAGLTVMDVVHTDVADPSSLDSGLEDARVAVEGAIASMDGDSEVGRVLSSELVEYLNRVDTHRSDQPWLERHVLTNTWRIVASKGPIQRKSNRRLEARARRVAKRIPGLQAWVRRVRSQ